MRQRKRARNRGPRGVTLLEGMIASGVLLIGLMGVFTGVVASSKQNSVANRMTKAAAIAAQVATGLQAQGTRKLVNTIMQSGNCKTTGTFIDKYADKLTNAPVEPLATICVTDLDAYDNIGPNASGTDPTAPNQVVPVYHPKDAEIFRRLLVVSFDPPDPETGLPPFVVVTVVVSFQVGMGDARGSYRHTVGFYNPAVNQTNIEI